MVSMTFNRRKPAVTNLGFTPKVGDWPLEDWKYADVEFVYARTNDLVKQVIDAVPLIGSFRRVLIDVKVQDLTPDIYSCIPGWHLDGAFPKETEIPDHHHLFVMNGPMTEFVAEPVVCDVRDPIDVTKIACQIPVGVRVATCEPNAITTFTSFDFHRGVKALKPTRRLLIRLTETNTVLAHNKPKAPSQGARRPATT